jgi:hypothetical protein
MITIIFITMLALVFHASSISQSRHDNTVTVSGEPALISPSTSSRW